MAEAPPEVDPIIGVVTAVVSLEGVEKRFGDVRALDGVDLSIEPGQLVALLGPNGAGKTTAVSLILGLRKPTAGTARLFGLSPYDRAARSRRGVMLQDSGVPQVLRVGELVDTFRAYYPKPLPAARALELAGLTELTRTLVGKLSGGQRQRLYYALAICGDPEVLFLDEPTVGMDVEGRRAFLESIRAFHQAGKTVVLTTHYLEEADELAERIVVIDRGKIIADAPPAQIKARVPGRRVSFRLPGFEAGMLGGAEYTALEIDGDRVRFLTNTAEAALAALFAAGLPITELEVTGADLEEAFLALTARAG